MGILNVMSSPRHEIVAQRGIPRQRELTLSSCLLPNEIWMGKSFGAKPLNNAWLGRGKIVTATTEKEAWEGGGGHQSSSREEAPRGG